jgi:hypothetical protein
VHAVNTGLFQNHVRLWIGPSNHRFAYLVTGNTVERWPLNTLLPGCD